MSENSNSSNEAQYTMKTDEALAAGSSTLHITQNFRFALNKRIFYVKSKNFSVAIVAI